MKKNFVLIFLLFFSIHSILKAQTISEFRKMDIPTKSQLLTDSVTSMLSLNTKQTQQIHQIIQNGLMELQPIMESDASRFTKMRKLKGIKNKYQPQVKSVLTQAQWQIWESDKKALVAYYKNQIGKIPLRTTIQ